MKDGNLWQQVECQVRRADAAAVFMRDCPLLECPRTPVTGNPDNRSAFNAQREARSSEHISALAMRQIDGTGVVNMNPPLVKTTYVLGNKAALIKIVLDGMKTPITIDGYEYRGIMPAQTTMTDQEVADVLTFVRRNFGNRATPVTAADVKAVRAKG